MAEARVLKRRGNPRGQAIFVGRATVTITGAATSGVTSVTYSPTYATGSEPKLICGIPEFVQTSGGATDYVTGAQLSSKTAKVFAIHAWLNAAPGSYKTVTLQFDYLVVGEPQD